MTKSSGDPQVYQPGFLPFKPERSFYFRGGLLVRVSSLHDLSSMGNRRASHVVGSALRFHLSIPQPSSDGCCARGLLSPLRARHHVFLVSLTGLMLILLMVMPGAFGVGRLLCLCRLPCVGPGRLPVIVYFSTSFLRRRVPYAATFSTSHNHQQQQ